MDIGTLTAIRRYPVKSLSGESLTTVEVGAAGLSGDRERALIVREGHARTGTTYRGKENDRLHLQGDESAARSLAAQSGVVLDVAAGDANVRFFDDAPVSIVVDRWLADASARLGFQIEPERFRSNFTIAAVAAFGSTEAALVGRLLEIGSVRLRVASPIDRCVTVTYAPDGSGNDPRVLRYLAQERANVMGIYCTVARPGVVRVGEQLRALAES